MGEVWRGKDTRLDRNVAIKVLPAGFAEDEERRQRFEREAKTISSLNHPAHLHAVRRRPRGRRALPRDGAARRRVARGPAAEGPAPARPGLQATARRSPTRSIAAHRQGIVHRDLKPGNVMLTKTGAKLLDFGLARSGAGLGGGSGLDRAADGGQAAHDRGHGPRHVPVHGARAARGGRGRRAHRHLRARRAALRDGDGAARVRGQVEDEPDRGDRLDAAAADLVGRSR